jgi:hypothetical protein
MPENIENLTLELLRALRNDIQTLRSEMHADFKDMKQRLTSLESAVTKSRGDSLSTQEDVYRQQAVIDRLVERIERIERRLELT